VDHQFEKTLKIRAEMEQTRLDFINTDLEVCLTFATVADTYNNMGHREHAKRTLTIAEKGYSDMLHFFSQAKRMTSEVEQQLKSKFKHLRDRLDGLQKLIHPDR
jgi:hypothetical protein